MVLFEMDVCLTLLMIDSIKSLALAQNEHYLYSASADKTVGVFNIISRKKEDSLDFIHTSIRNAYGSVANIGVRYNRCDQIDQA